MSGTGHAGQQAAQIAKGALSQGENAAGLGMGMRCDPRVDFLRILQRPEERVADVHLLVEVREGLRERCLVKRGGRLERRAEVPHGAGHG